MHYLAKDNSISNFNLVVFLGSDLDHYIPLYSATMQYEGKNL